MLLYLTMISSEEDRDKFELIYNRYKKTMFYVANSILKDNHHAEDAVSISFIKILKHLDKIDDVECNKTKGFIVIIVKNTSIDLYRKIKRQNENIYTLENENSLVENFDIEVENSVQLAILRLPEKYKKVFFLRYCHHLEYDEIARILNTKETTIRSIISRGKKKLEFILRDMKVV